MEVAFISVKQSRSLIPRKEVGKSGGGKFMKKPEAELSQEYES